MAPGEHRHRAGDMSATVLTFLYEEIDGKEKILLDRSMCRRAGTSESQPPL